MLRLSSCSALFLFALLVLPACDSSELTDEPEVNVPSDDDAGIVLPSCESNADCAGGEVCRNELCEQACDDENNRADLDVNGLTDSGLLSKIPLT
ncbi:MAG: hypothetical protein GY822_06200 [Deltaproteobacteria bacterium]|nr:hypothetical protein [Deltaproteobacteria bacterium]